MMRDFLKQINPYKQTIWIVNVSKWKRKIVSHYFKEYRVKFLGINTNPYDKEKWILKSRPIVLFWGRYVPYAFERFCVEHAVPIWHMEDGFLRSIGLGASHIPPFSLCIDKKGIYYDSSATSDLEEFILKGEVTETDKNIATECISRIKSLNLTKYNLNTDANLNFLFEVAKKKILVVGQVEDDQSMIYGCDKIITNADLIELALNENLDAQVLYKPHPDVLNGFRKEVSSLTKFEGLITVIDINTSITSIIKNVDHVYTITSLAGFEALMHGVKVTTVGAPFYSNWGLTDDRQIVNRRNVKRSLETIFFATYMYYAKYRDPNTGKQLDLEDVIDLFSEELAKKKLHDDLILGKQRLYNFSTFHPVSMDYLERSVNKNKICVITDTVKSRSYVSELSKHGKSVDLLTVREKQANEVEFNSSFYGLKNIEVSSIHKFFNHPLGSVEEKTIDVCEQVESKFYDVSMIYNSGLIPNSLIKELCVGVRDYIYFDVLRFIVMENIIDDYDAVLLLLDDPIIGEDVLYASYYYGKEKSMLHKIYFRSFDNSYNYKSLFDILGKAFKPVATSPVEVSSKKEVFASFFWDLHYSRTELFPNVKGFIGVCGNINGDNYAYAPSTYKILDYLNNSLNKNIVYFNSGFTNPNIDESIKASIFNLNLKNSICIYDGGYARFKKQYSNDLLDTLNLIKSDFYNYLCQVLIRYFPKAFVLSLSKRFERFTEVFFHMVVAYVELDHLFDRIECFGTTMYNGFYSRFLTELTSLKGKNTFAIQPQVISVSRRYLAPNVDYLGTIDEIQSSNFKALGYRGNICKVGSVNLIERLSYLETLVTNKIQEFDIIFVMQHSARKVMENIAISISKLIAETGCRVCIKPHPHQELSVDLNIRSILNGDNVVFLSKSADTYTYMSKSKVVVGYFSSSLFEAAVFGKKVIVMDLFSDSVNKLDSSIDFSRYSLAVKVSNYEGFKAEYLSAINCVKNDDLDVEYFMLNKHLLPPYNYNKMNYFLNHTIHKD